MPLPVNAVKQFLNLADFRFGGSLDSQELQNKFLCRAAKNAIEKIADDLALGFLFRNRGPKNLWPRRVVTMEQPLITHDLDEFESSCMPDTGTSLRL